MRTISLIMMSIGLGATLAEADDKACLGCHAMIQAILSKGNSHPAMALGCQTCHTDHIQSAADRRPSNTSGHYLIAAPVELCVRCHAEVVKKEFVHEPVKKDCTICHSPHDGLSDGLRAKSNALCLECHSESLASKFGPDGGLKLFAGKLTLPPHYFDNVQLLALQNDRGHPVSNHPVLRPQDEKWPEVSCAVCHKPHGADKSAALLTTETAGFEPLCQRCHQ